MKEIKLKEAKQKEEIIRTCLVCKKIIDTDIYRSEKFCSKKHQKKFWKDFHYMNNKQKYIEYAKKWKKNNPSKAKAYLRKWYNKNRDYHISRCYKDYSINKQKWTSRKLTLQLYNDDRIPLKKICLCGNLKQLELHHEVYPATVKEIIMAVKNNQIFFLCRDCHRKRDAQKHCKKHKLNRNAFDGSLYNNLINQVPYDNVYKA